MFFFTGCQGNLYHASGIVRTIHGIALGIIR